MVLTGQLLSLGGVRSNFLAERNEKAKDHTMAIQTLSAIV
jgi:hypothetical protein